MAEYGGLLINNTSISLRNARIIDRTQLRGYNMTSQEKAFAVYHGGDDAAGTIKVSHDQWLNGQLALTGSGRSDTDVSGVVIYDASGTITIGVSGVANYVL